MKAVLSGMAMAALLAFGTSQVFPTFAIPAEQAYSTVGARPTLK